MEKRIELPYQHENHRPAMTRRDLFGRGALTFGAYVATPGILSMLSRSAMAAEGELSCSAASAPGMVPFIVIDLAGGGNIAGTNVWVGGLQGQSDPLPAGSYGTLGLAPSQAPGTVAPNEELGLWFHPASKMLAGIKQTALPGTLTNVDGALFCTSSGDDSRANPHNPLYWIAEAGLGGQLVSLVGTGDSVSGGNASAPAASINPSRQPSRITRPQDALGLVNPGKLATLMQTVSTAAGQGLLDVQKVLAATKTMSESRLRMFQSKDLPSQVQDLIRCGYINSSDFLSKFSATALNPLTDTAVTGVFTQLAANQDEQKAGTIAKLVLDGYAGAGVISLGGYDYHGQGRATQDQRDLEAGRMIGQVLQLAAAKSKPVMIYVYTDGGVSSGQAGDVGGIYPWANDSGQRSAAMTLVYKPGAEGRTGISRGGVRQIGAYKAGGAVDETANKISSSVENLSKAVVANYLALHGREGELAAVVGTDPFGAAELEQYLAFGQIVPKT